MEAKKVVKFLFLTSAFSQRNVTSILLVVLFFVVYIMSGGKVSLEMPKFPEGGGFGGVRFEEDPLAESRAVPPLNAPEEDVKRASKSSSQVLGLVPSEDAAARISERNRRGSQLALDESEGNEEFKLRNESSGETPRSVRRQRDGLAALENRLNIRRNSSGGSGE